MMSNQEAHVKQVYNDLQNQGRILDAELIQDAFFSKAGETIRVTITDEDSLSSLSLVTFDWEAEEDFELLFPMTLVIGTSVNNLNWLKSFNKPLPILYNKEGDYIIGKIEDFTV